MTPLILAAALAGAPPAELPVPREVKAQPHLQVWANLSSELGRSVTTIEIGPMPGRKFRFDKPEWAARIVSEFEDPHDGSLQRTIPQWTDSRQCRVLGAIARIIQSFINTTDPYEAEDGSEIVLHHDANYRMSLAADFKRYPGELERVYTAYSGDKERGDFLQLISMSGELLADCWKGKVRSYWIAPGEAPFPAPDPIKMPEASSGAPPE